MSGKAKVSEPPSLEEKVMAIQVVLEKKVVGVCFCYIYLALYKCTDR